MGLSPTILWDASENLPPFWVSPGTPAWLQGKAFCRLTGQDWLATREPPTRQELSQLQGEETHQVQPRHHTIETCVHQGDWWKSDEYKTIGANWPQQIDSDGYKRTIWETVGVHPPPTAEDHQRRTHGMPRDPGWWLSLFPFPGLAYLSLSLSPLFPLCFFPSFFPFFMPFFVRPLLLES